jgi:hypothetical protein
MQHARRPHRNRRTSSSRDPAQLRAAPVRLDCCRFPSNRRRSNVSTPATVRGHSGWPPSYPTCGTAWSARLRTIRAKTAATAAPVLYEPVAARRVVVPCVDYKIALSPAPDLETDNAHPLGRAGDRAREVLTNLSFVCPFS